MLAVALLGLAACTTDDEVGTAQAPARSGFAAGLAWFRVDLAYVSAYVLVRGRQAAVVDTGYGEGRPHRGGPRGRRDRVGRV